MRKQDLVIRRLRVEVPSLKRDKKGTSRGINQGWNPLAAKEVSTIPTRPRVWAPSNVGLQSHPWGLKKVPKGLAVRQLKRYVSWVQNVVRQFGPYPMRAQDT